MPLGVLGVAGAKFLQREIHSDENDLIGFGHGRTLASCVTHLPKLDAKNTQFVSLLGGLNKNFSANPHDVMHRLAEKTGADSFVMPVPFFANSREDRERRRERIERALEKGFERGCEGGLREDATEE